MISIFQTKKIKFISFIRGRGGAIDEEENVQRDQEDVSKSSTNLQYLAGVIDTEDTLRFKRIVFRTTRGNCFTQINELQQDEIGSLGDEVNNFLIYFRNKNKTKFNIF